MAQTSKAYRAAKALVQEGHFYAPSEAVSLAKKTTSQKFDSTVEVAIKLGVDQRKADQMVRGTVSLPHGTGKTARVLVFATGPAAEAALAAGADEVGGDELIEKVAGGYTNFDAAVSTPELMGKVGTLGKVLGPRGLMPNPKTGTVTPDVETAVQNAKAGQMRFRTDKNGIIHGGIGKVNFEPDAIKGNWIAVLSDLKKAKPASAKGVYVRKVTLSTTMGPGVTIDHNAIDF